MQNGIFFLTSKSSLFFINLSGHTPALSQIRVVGREEKKQTEEKSKVFSSSSMFARDYFLQFLKKKNGREKNCLLLSWTYRCWYRSWGRRNVSQPLQVRAPSLIQKETLQVSFPSCNTKETLLFSSKETW